MVVKEGYKMTEVGMIPEDWEILTLGQISEIKTGPFGSALHQKDYVDDGTPIITVEHLSENGVMHQNLPMVSEPDKKRLNAYLLKSGDIVFSRVGSVDRNSLVGEKEEGWLFSGRLLRIRVNNKNILPEFISFVLNQEQTKQRVRSVAVGQTMPSLNTAILRGVEVYFPPTKSEQTAIATALSDADALIRSLERLIEKKRAIKQGAMQELLKPKAGWVVKRLGEIADNNKKWSFTGGPFGSNLKSSDYTEAGVRIIQLQNIGDGEFIHDSEVFTSIEKADELLSCNIFPGEIILSKMGDPVARACIIPETHSRYLMCSDGIRLAVNEKKYDPYFIFIYINAPGFRTLAENTSTGSTRKRIGLVQLKNLELTVPDYNEQKFIANAMRSIDSEISSLEQRLTKCKMLKQGMMQELLTGRIRLV